MIETVIFDLGNVLVDVRQDTLQRDLSALLDATPEELGEQLKGLLPLLEVYERGRLNGVAFYRRVLDHFGLAQERYPFALYREHWCGALVPSPAMERLYREVCRARQVCVLSNTNDLHWMHTAERFDLLQRAQSTLTSFECGLYKPEPAIYHLAMERFSVDEPATALFIDDRPENVQAACDVGMKHSFVHQSEPDTRKRLEAAGIL